MFFDINNKIQLKQLQHDLNQYYGTTNNYVYDILLRDGNSDKIYRNIKENVRTLIIYYKLQTMSSHYNVTVDIDFNVITDMKKLFTLLVKQIDHSIVQKEEQLKLYQYRIYHDTHFS